MHLDVAGWWWGALSFLGSYLAHLAWWRAFSPRKDVVALVALCLVPAGMLLLMGWLSPIQALTHALFAGNYIAIYPAFQASSPTLKILVSLRRSPQGLTLDSIRSLVASDAAITDRYKDLQRAGLVREGGLSRKGEWLAAFFVQYRRLLGLQRGAG